MRPVQSSGSPWGSAVKFTHSMPNSDEPAEPPNAYLPVIACAALLGASSLLFYFVPGIDLVVSGWFYRPEGGFWLGKTLPIVAMRNLGIWITIGTILGLIGLGVLWHLRPHHLDRWHSGQAQLDWRFIALGLALGPGLLVNLIFKPVWGRARPVHIEQFGGHDVFTPAWTWAHQCKWNCSFFSGEAAASAFFLAFYVVVPVRWRTATLVAGCVVTALVSFARIAAGGHFLSDVVTAWLMILLLILVLRAQMYHGQMLGPLKRWLTPRA